ncbi:lipopolysaccharide biosynthesis protein [Streptococcus merionis]|uniref:Polysaccharide flippase transporter n=1 Tax=Streptococcus merionis TaxID=400065 RepID=A0A239SS77_9STRE|nr:lipopolysaccharide biosynthesis protein [Streptococcus merionis]SNU88267.1 polysaccharide flippase transporter [Streptococcus merionis]
MDIKKSFRDGILFTAIGKYSNVIIQLVITTILSRLISPTEYGIVAVVNVFLVFFQILADSGIGPAIIQNKELTSRDINNIFSLTVFTGAILGIAFVILGQPISLLYDNVIYTKLCLLLGICVFFYTITIVPQSVLNKSLKFKQVSLLTLCANVLSGILAIIFAFSGFGVYTLVLSNIIKAFVIFVLLYSQVSLKFYFRLDKSSLLKIFDFAKFQFFSNFLNYFARNLDNLLIGSVFSSAALGYYDKSYQLSLYPNQILSQVITPAIHPIMSNFSDDRKKMSDVFFKISSVMIMVGIPISTFLIFNARDIILIMFGDNWIPSVDSFKILSASIWLQMANSFLSSFYQATNNAKTLFKVGVVTSTLNVVAILVGVFFGSIETVALALLVSFTFVLVITIYFLQKLINFSIFNYLKIILVNSICILPFVVFNVFFINLELKAFYNFAVEAILLVGTWGIMMLITGNYKQLLFLIKNKR